MLTDSTPQSDINGQSHEGLHCLAKVLKQLKTRLYAQESCVELLRFSNI